MAAPHVVGVAALVAERRERRAHRQRRSRPDPRDGLAARGDRRQDRDRTARECPASDRHRGTVATPIDRHGINVGSIVGSTVSTTMTWPAATDALSGVKSYAIKRSLNGGGMDDARSRRTTRSYKRGDVVRDTDPIPALGARRRRAISAGAPRADRHGHALAGRDQRAKYTRAVVEREPVVGQQRAPAPHRRARARRSRSRRSARAIAVVGRRGPLNGKAKVYVDGVYKTTINLFGRATCRRSWCSTRPGTAPRSTRSSWSRSPARAGRGSRSTRSPSCAGRGSTGRLSCRDRSSSRTAPAAAGCGSCAPRRSRAGRPRAS